MKGRKGRRGEGKTILSGLFERKKENRGGGLLEKRPGGKVIKSSFDKSLGTGRKKVGRER